MVKKQQRTVHLISFEPWILDLTSSPTKIIPCLKYPLTQRYITAIPLKQNIPWRRVSISNPLTHRYPFGLHVAFSWAMRYPRISSDAEVPFHTAYIEMFPPYVPLILTGHLGHIIRPARTYIHSMSILWVSWLVIWFSSKVRLTISIRLVLGYFFCRKTLGACSLHHADTNSKIATYAIHTRHPMRREIMYERA